MYKRQLFEACDFPLAHRTRFFSSFLNLMKTPACHALIDRSLADGDSVMVTVQHTGEAAQRRATHALRPTNVCVDILGQDLRIPESAVRFVDGLLDPVDSIVHAYGARNVAELTTRAKRWVFHEATGQWIQERVPSFRAELDAFQTGKKRVAVLSSAASVGLSMHDVLGRHRRHHIFMEVPWSACAFLQQMGRSNRSHQRTLPRYTFVKTSVPAEVRKLQALSWGLTRLGALTCADQGNKIAPFSKVFSQVPDYESGGQAAFVSTALYLGYRFICRRLGLDEMHAVRERARRSTQHYRTAQEALSMVFTATRRSYAAAVDAAVPHVAGSCGWGDYRRRFEHLPFTTQGELLALHMMHRRKGDSGGVAVLNDDVVRNIAGYLVPVVDDGHVKDICKWIKFKPGYGVQHFLNAMMAMPIDGQRRLYGLYAAHYAKTCRRRKRIVGLGEYVLKSAAASGCFHLDTAETRTDDEHRVDVTVRYAPPADRLPAWIGDSTLVGMYRRPAASAPIACVVKRSAGFAVHYAGRAGASRQYATLEDIAHAGYVALDIDDAARRAWEHEAAQFHARQERRARKKSGRVRFARRNAIEMWAESKQVVVRVERPHVAEPFTALVL